MEGCLGPGQDGGSLGKLHCCQYGLKAMCAVPKLWAGRRDALLYSSFLLPVFLAGPLTQFPPDQLPNLHRPACLPCLILQLCIPWPSTCAA